VSFLQGHDPICELQDKIDWLPKANYKPAIATSAINVLNEQEVKGVPPALSCTSVAGDTGLIHQLPALQYMLGR
jgi:hypothetical protein